MSSPIGLILEIIVFLIGSTLGTLFDVMRLSGELLLSLINVSGFGTMALILSVLILTGVLFFLWKFFIGSLKTIILLFAAGCVILTIVFMLA